MSSVVERTPGEAAIDFGRRCGYSFVLEGRPCSHVWRDAEYLNQTVGNHNVSPMIPQGCICGDYAHRHMRYGREYICIGCGTTCKPQERADG